MRSTILLALALATPAPAFTVPCRIVYVVDGDTVDVEYTTKIRVRLRDCWAPEMKGPQRPDGLLSKAAMQAYVDHAEGQGVLSVPLPAELTFGRVVGDVWLRGDDETVSERMCVGGFATKTKQGKQD